MAKPSNPSTAQPPAPLKSSIFRNALATTPRYVACAPGSVTLTCAGCGAPRDDVSLKRCAHCGEIFVPGESPR